MPSLLSPLPGSSSSRLNPDTKSYSPLADEVNPPFGNVAPAPSVTRNGTIVYSKRLHNGPGDLGDIGDEEHQEETRGSDRLRSESEETLSPYPSQKGKIRETEEGDIGEIRSIRKAKGKERQWDPERGDEEEDVNGLSYPPIQEDAEEERRIQEKLAMFAARDMARRRAARMSRTLPTSPQPNSPMSVTSARRPLSGHGGGERNSLMGLVGGFWGGTKAKESWHGELQSTSPEQHTYTNPYDAQAAFPPVPRMVVSPSNDASSPFADPEVRATRRVSTNSTASGSSQSPIGSPIEADALGFTYGGPGWRGGADATPAQGTIVQSRRGGDKWWHALCAWGEDLDGDENGQSGQAGRTNPFE